MLLKYLLIFIALFSYLNASWTQGNSIIYSYSNFENILKQNSVLVNGKYFENIYRLDLGSPYYVSDDFANGHIEIRGNEFNNVPLRYNIHDQTLQVRVVDGQSANIILPPVSFISAFSIYDKEFTLHTSAQNELIFLFKLYEGTHLDGFSGFEKKRNISYHIPKTTAYKFSDTRQNYFVLINGQLFEITSKRKFLKLFDDSLHKDMKKFMRKQSINIRNISEVELKTLLKFSESIY